MLCLPKAVHFVMPEFISDCLGMGECLPEDRYFIDVYRMAILASKPKVGHSLTRHGFRAVVSMASSAQQ